MCNAWRPTKNTLPRAILFSLDSLDTVHWPWENAFVTGHWTLDRLAYRKHTARVLFDSSGGTFSASVANLCKVRVSQHTWFIKHEPESRLYRIVMTSCHLMAISQVCVLRRDAIHTIFRKSDRKVLGMSNVTYANTICSIFILI